jgi:hypothetical protein
MIIVKISTAILGCIFNAAGLFFLASRELQYQSLPIQQYLFLWIMFIRYKIDFRKNPS